MFFQDHRFIFKFKFEFGKIMKFFRFEFTAMLETYTSMCVLAYFY